jgi:uncharacterized protein (TIGR00730 family)
MRIESLCVFCGSNSGSRDVYRAAAESLGRHLGERKIRLVFGGGSCGLMGVVADAAIAAKGEVIGVIPKALERREIAHYGLSELRVVGSMHERKALMAELSDGFIALPGGLGTLEELFEALTWSQLGIHSKPIAVLNVSGYFDPLLVLLDRHVAEGFLRPEHRAMLIHGDDVEGLLERMAEYRPVALEKWLDLDEG